MVGSGVMGTGVVGTAVVETGVVGTAVVGPGVVGTTVVGTIVVGGVSVFVGVPIPTLIFPGTQDTWMAIPFWSAKSNPSGAACVARVVTVVLPAPFA